MMNVNNTVTPPAPLHLFGSQYGLDTRRVVEQHLRSELDERASTAGVEVASVDLWWPWVNICMGLARLRSPAPGDGIADEWRLAQVDVDELMTSNHPDDIDRAFRVMYLDERCVPILRTCATRLEAGHA